MAAIGPVAARLRAYVRERASKDGAQYEWGNAKRLAEHLKVDSSWVTGYTDDPPTNHADLDTVLGICDFYGLNLLDLAKGRIREMPRPDPLVPAVTEVVEKWRGDRESLVTFVNLLRQSAGLPAFVPARERKRGR